MIPLGYGKFVRADRVYALVPLEGAERGDGERGVRGAAGENDAIDALCLFTRYPFLEHIVLYPLRIAIKRIAITTATAVDAKGKRHYATGYAVGFHAAINKQVTMIDANHPVQDRIILTEGKGLFGLDLAL